MGFLLSFLLFIPDDSRHARQNDAEIIWTVVTRRKTKGAQGTLREAAVNTLLREQLQSQCRAAQPGGVRQVCGPSCAAVICSYSSANGRDPPRSCGAEAGEPPFSRGQALPGYSPDCNADEAVWGWVREEATGNLCLGIKTLVQERVSNFLDLLASRK